MRLSMALLDPLAVLLTLAAARTAVGCRTSAKAKARSAASMVMVSPSASTHFSFAIALRTSSMQRRSYEPIESKRWGEGATMAM